MALTLTQLFISESLVTKQPVKLPVRYPVLKPPVPGMFIVPPVPNSDNVAFTLIIPFRDPVGTFRAHALSDMYRVIPDPIRVYDYSIGAPPDIKPRIFTIQNRTVSNTLEVKLTLPSYLRVILANVGPIAAPPENPFVFHVPARGDTTTFPIAVSAPILASGQVDAQFLALAQAAYANQNIIIKNTPLQIELTGEGIVNIVVVFDEHQALTFLPGDFVEGIIFDVTPLDVTGPVFVDVNSIDPPDLNPIVEANGSLSPVSSQTDQTAAENVVEIPVIVEKEVFVPDLVPRWIDGTDGLLKSGSAPTGWHTEADGRLYPPIGGTTTTGVTGGEAATGVAGLFITASASQSLTPLETLVAEVKNAPPTFIGATRRGFIIDPTQFLQGIQPERVSRESIPMFVADLGIQTQFAILNWQKTFNNGQPVPSPEQDARTREFFQLVNMAVDQVRADSIPFTPATIRQWTVSLNVKNLLEKNEKFDVKTSLTEDDIQLARSIVAAMSIIRDINLNGIGEAVK